MKLDSITVDISVRGADEAVSKLDALASAAEAAARALVELRAAMEVWVSTVNVSVQSSTPVGLSVDEIGSLVQAGPL